MPGKFHGWRNLIGYSPWGHKESDTTEQFHFKVGIRVRVKVTFKIEVRIKFRVEDRPRLGVNSEKAMAPHSSTLAWKIPRMEEPHRLQSMGSQRVRHD